MQTNFSSMLCSLFVQVGLLFFLLILQLSRTNVEKSCAQSEETSEDADAKEQVSDSKRNSMPIMPIKSQDTDETVKLEDDALSMNTPKDTTTDSGEIVKIEDNTSSPRVPKDIKMTSPSIVKLERKVLPARSARKKNLGSVETPEGRRSARLRTG